MRRLNGPRISKRDKAMLGRWLKSKRRADPVLADKLLRKMCKGLR